MAMSPKLLRPRARQAGAATDPYFANVALLLHMNGANGSTTFTDSSLHARTVAGFGGAAISTGQSKFGGASALLGVGKYLTTDDIVGEFGTQPFTVECWLFLTEAGDTFPTIFSNYQTFGTSVMVLFEGASGDKWELTYDGNYPGIVSSANIAYNQWVHVAVVRNANTLALYVDGVREGTADVTGVSLDGNANAFFINAAGDNPSVTNATGYFDEFRVTKGVARYNGASFPVPTAPFPNSGPAAPPAATSPSLWKSETLRPSYHWST